MHSLVDHSPAEVPGGSDSSDSSGWAPPPGDVRSAPFRTG